MTTNQETSLRELAAKWRDNATAMRANQPLPAWQRAEELEACADELEAALSARAEPQAGEWVLVPREPTQAMVQAGLTAKAYIGEGFTTATWKAMLAAAPSPASRARPEAQGEDRVAIPWAEYWMQQGRIDVSHDFHAFELADEWRKANIAAVAPAGMDGWQPIATAPKDGRGVLLCWSSYDPDKPSSGVFVQVAEWWENEGGDDGEWVVYCDLPQEPRLRFTPTHWQPIPPPPAEGEAA